MFRIHCGTTRQIVNLVGRGSSVNFHPVDTGEGLGGIEEVGGHILLTGEHLLLAVAECAEHKVALVDNRRGDGEVVGVGTHEELLKKNKIYKEIAESQLSKEELTTGGKNEK